jgi:hypothetical protein
MNPINHIPSPSSPPFILPLHRGTPQLYLFFHFQFQSQCSEGFLDVSQLSIYFILVVHPLLFSLTLSLLPAIIQQLSYILLLLYLHRYNVFQYCWISSISFSFLSSPEFHIVASLLLTWSTYTCVYDLGWFIFWIYLPHMRESMWPLFFWTSYVQKYYFT